MALARGYAMARHRLALGYIFAKKALCSPQFGYICDFSCIG